MAGLWSGEVIHALRLRRASFDALCPDPPTRCSPGSTVSTRRLVSSAPSSSSTLRSARLTNPDDRLALRRYRRSVLDIGATRKPPLCCAAPNSAAPREIAQFIVDFLRTMTT